MCLSFWDTDLKWGFRYTFLRHSEEERQLAPTFRGSDLNAYHIYSDKL